MKNILLTFFLIFITVNAYACHLVTITETNSVENSDGTYTYTFDICVGAEDTYGFYLTFTGANLISYEPSVTSASLGTTISPTVPPQSGTGDIEYGDWDDSGDPLYSGGSNDCVSATFTFDGPISNAEIGGTQAFYFGGPCSGTTTTTNCFSADYSIELTTDNWGGETSWELVDQPSGSVVASGSGYSSNTTYNVPICAPDGCYSFDIFDSFGDGICCSEGNGSYSVTNSAGTVVASGGDYGSGESTEIGCVVLPIELISFNGKPDRGLNKLEWVVASQLNNDYFVIEHSADGKQWQRLTKVDGEGTTNQEKSYTFDHYFNNTSINYYRLSQFDFNGDSHVFPIIAINNDEGNQGKVIKRLNSMGQVVSPDYEGVVFEYYSDGTTRKIINQ